VTFGTVARAHGVRGELRVRPLDAKETFPNEIQVVRLTSRGGVERQYRVTSARPAHGAVLMCLAGITDRDAAQALSGSRLEVAAEELPPPAPGELYVYELEGAQVIDERGVELGVGGRVVGVSGQQLLEVNTARGAQLLPLAQGAVLDFDRVKHRLTVRVPDGLWD